MELFYQTFGFVAAICTGIIILAVFFTAVGYFKRATRGFDIVKMKGFMKDGKPINVHLANGKTLLGVRFIGFTDFGGSRAVIPHQLSGMAVLETASGTRIYIRADSVRMFEEIEKIT
jgi:hypothetical protein